MAKVSMDLDALKEAFAAKGGVATVVALGARAIESDRTIYNAMREGTRAVADSVAQDRDAEMQHHIANDAFRAAKLAGWTNENALDNADHAV